jgi:hypothetical protein
MAVDAEVGATWAGPSQSIYLVLGLWPVWHSPAAGGRLQSTTTGNPGPLCQRHRTPALVSR